MDSEKTMRSSAQITVDRIKKTRPDEYDDVAKLLWRQAPGWALQLVTSLNLHNPYTKKGSDE